MNTSASEGAAHSPTAALWTESSSETKEVGVVGGDDEGVGPVSTEGVFPGPIMTQEVQESGDEGGDSNPPRTEVWTALLVVVGFFFLFTKGQTTTRASRTGFRFRGAFFGEGGGGGGGAEETSWK